VLATADSIHLKGRLIQTGAPAEITIESGVIVRVEAGRAAPGEPLPWIAPGLIDLQINGYAGVNFNEVPIRAERVNEVTRKLLAEGVTGYLPTVTTNQIDRITEELASIAECRRTDPLVREAVPGIHLEGPFITPEDGARGAHRREHVCAPDWELFMRFQDAADGLIRIITLSPEWEGAESFIAKCAESGVIVSIGHTSASPEQIRRAVRAGARMSTHLGNGTHPMLPRHPNYLWEQLAADELRPCLIPDGFHLPDSVLKVMLRVKRDQAMLVSDTTYLGGMPPGNYVSQKGIAVTKTAEGKLVLTDNPALLAGSAQLLPWGIRHLVRRGLCSLAEAWEMASTRPAAFLNVPVRQGIAAGAPADVVVFDWNETEQDLVIRQVYKHGEPMRQEPAS